jgi:hypothetical protein
MARMTIDQLTRSGKNRRTRRGRQGTPPASSKVRGEADRLAVSIRYDNSAATDPAVMNSYKALALAQLADDIERLASVY